MVSAEEDADTHDESSLDQECAAAGEAKCQVSRFCSGFMRHYVIFILSSLIETCIISILDKKGSATDSPCSDLWSAVQPYLSH